MNKEDERVLDGKLRRGMEMKSDKSGGFCWLFAVPSTCKVLVQG